MRRNANRLSSLRHLRGLRPQLLLWTILPLTFILIVISVLGVYGHQRAMRDLVAQRDTRLVNVAAGQIGQRLERWLDVLRLLADSPDDLDLPPSVMAAFDGGIVVIEDPPLGPVCSLARSVGEATTGQTGCTQPAAWSSWESLARNLTREAAARGEVAFSPVVEDASEGRPFILMAVTSPTGHRALVGALAMEQLQIRSVMSALAAGPRATAYLVDGRGYVLWHPDPNQIGQDRSSEEEVAAVGQGAAGALFRRQPGLGEVVSSYAPIRPVGWGLVVSEPWGDVTGTMMQFSLITPLLVLAAAVVSLLAITFGVQRVIRPLQALHHQVRRVAWGDFEATETPVGGVQEIEDLRQAIQTMAGQIRRYQSSLRSYIGAMTRGQEEERARLARELHDDTAQSLIAILQQVEMAQKALSRNPEQAAARLAAVRETVTATLESVRRFTRDLRPLYLEDLGLVPALEMLVRDLEARDDLHATLHLQGEVQRLDRDLELAVYRIAQEALSNVSKHAQASQVSVTLAFEEDGVTVSVEDDGVGFEAPERPNELAQQGHFGLVGMRERALLSGGHLSIESRVNGCPGTRVSAHFPRG